MGDFRLDQLIFTERERERPMLCFLSALITLASANPHADTARWRIHNSNWGYVSELSDLHTTVPTAEVLSC